MIVDLFAGPGGWDHALTAWPDLHADAVGFEFDRWACATRAAAGHRTVRADVAEVGLERLMGTDVDGLIGSPPCQTFSSAGSGAGRALLAYLVDHAHRGELLHTEDPRIGLVLEPARWARWLRPGWIALEQVPAVLPIWEAIAHYLRSLGYRTWTGILNAADYGVPQTRRRAILTASLDHQPHRPPPTHERDPGGLFGLRPWATMAEALGWGHDGAAVVSTGVNSMVTGRSAMDLQPFERSIDRPAPTLDTKAQREGDRPAPTMTAEGLPADRHRPSRLGHLGPGARPLHATTAPPTTRRPAQPVRLTRRRSPEREDHPPPPTEENPPP